MIHGHVCLGLKDTNLWLHIKAEVGFPKHYIVDVGKGQKPFRPVR